MNTFPHPRPELVLLQPVVMAAHDSGQGNLFSINLACYETWIFSYNRMYTSSGGGFAALWRYPDWSSAAQLLGIPYPWLSSAWRVTKVGVTSRYDIKSWQPFHCARTCKDNLVTSMTWFVWSKKVECTTWSLYQIPHIWCHATLHTNDCLYRGEYSTK